MHASKGKKRTVRLCETPGHQLVESHLAFLHVAGRDMACCELNAGFGYVPSQTIHAHAHTLNMQSNLSSVVEPLSHLRICGHWLGRITATRRRTGWSAVVRQLEEKRGGDPIHSRQHEAVMQPYPLSTLTLVRFHLWTRLVATLEVGFVNQSAQHKHSRDLA